METIQENHNAKGEIIKINNNHVMCQCACTFKRHTCIYLNFTCLIMMPPSVSEPFASIFDCLECLQLYARSCHAWCISSHPSCCLPFAQDLSLLPSTYVSPRFLRPSSQCVHIPAQHGWPRFQCGVFWNQIYPNVVAPPLFLFPGVTPLICLNLIIVSKTPSSFLRSFHILLLRISTALVFV